MTNYGIMFRCQKPPETLRESVKRIEAAGFDEAWLVEDCFFAGGIASAATALAATERIKVGLGIVPAVVRNPAFTAMEFAALARLFPGRFLPGIGHGVGAWMKQIGAFPVSQLAALEEVTQVVRALLSGERVTFHGKHVHLDDVKLDFPPSVVPPLQLGVRGPKSLALSGRVADGTILAEGAAPAYVSWAKELIAAGREQAGREDRQRMTVYVWTSIDDDRQQARDLVRPSVAGSLRSSWQQLAPLGIQEQAKQLLKEHEGDDLVQAIPEECLDLLSVSGTVKDCLQAVRRFEAISVDSLVFVLPFENEVAQIERLASDLLPLLRK
jgi:alkanesulfonate monooxygenase SsuD/methylene tetrahydromethanopterin reductase-like flavin-dependent oxidoreductase (luciferase family)